MFLENKSSQNNNFVIGVDKYNQNYYLMNFQVALIFVSSLLNIYYSKLIHKKNAKYFTNLTRQKGREFGKLYIITLIKHSLPSIYKTILKILLLQSNFFIKVAKKSEFCGNVRVSFGRHRRIVNDVRYKYFQADFLVLLIFQ